MKEERERREAEQEVEDDAPVVHGGEGDPLGQGVEDPNSEEENDSP